MWREGLSRKGARNMKSRQARIRGKGVNDFPEMAVTTPKP